MAKRLEIKGTVLRSRPQRERLALAKQFRDELLPLFQQGKLKPVIDSVRPTEAVAEAHQQLENNATTGKLVLHW